MHKPHAPCEDLIRHTANALTDDNMRKIFISTQKNNIKLCVEFAIHNNFHETLQRGRTVAQNLLALAAWFPLSSNREMFKSQEISLTDFTELASFVTRKYYDIKMSRRSSYMMAAKALIILENCSYRRGTLKENISAAIEAFKSSDVKSKLNKRIKAESKENRTDEELQKWLYGIICNNLMDHQNLVFSPQLVAEATRSPRMNTTDLDA